MIDAGACTDTAYRCQMLLEKTAAALYSARVMNLGTTQANIKSKYDSGTGDDGSSVISNSRSVLSARSGHSGRSGPSVRSGRVSRSNRNRSGRNRSDLERGRDAKAAPSRTRRW